MLAAVLFLGKGFFDQSCDFFAAYIYRLNFLIAAGTGFSAGGLR